MVLKTARMSSFPSSRLFRLFLLAFLTQAREPAFAIVTGTAQSLDRLEETLRAALDEGGLKQADLVPMLVVSSAPHYEESRASFRPAATSTLGKVFPGGTLRVCEACMEAQTRADAGALEIRLGDAGFEEIRAADDRIRGASSPAKSAVWLDETREGVAIRILDLRTGRVLHADNLSPTLAWAARSARSFNLSQDLRRKMRGDSLTHVFFDVGIYPNQMLAFDWTEQWGRANENLTGLSFSFFNPVMGLGPTYLRVFREAMGLGLGGKIMLSVPNALLRSISKTAPRNFLDPLLTFTGIARFPFPFLDGNYGAMLFASSNGRVGLGISTFNISLLPVLP